MADPDKKPSPDPAPERELKLLGTPFRRVDGRAKVTGATRFADDLAFPRMAYLKLVRSTVPHARIAKIDVSAAAAVPGVLGFLTGAAYVLTTGFGDADHADGLRTAHEAARRHGLDGEAIHVAVAAQGEVHFLAVARLLRRIEDDHVEALAVGDNIA